MAGQSDTVMFGVRHYEPPPPQRSLVSLYWTRSEGVGVKKLEQVLVECSGGFLCEERPNSGQSACG
jgi:hypothetical protein